MLQLNVIFPFYLHENKHVPLAKLIYIIMETLLLSYRLPHGPLPLFCCWGLEFSVGKYSSLFISGATFLPRGRGLANVG